MVCFLRIYVTDWARGFLYVYKNNVIEKKIGGRKMFSRPRDILLDSLDSILVSDIDKNTFYFLDNKGTYLFETKMPRLKGQSKDEDKSIFGINRIENNKLIFVTNSSIYICNLLKF